MSGEVNNRSGAGGGATERTASYSKLNQEDPQQPPEPQPRRPLTATRWQFSRTKCLFVSLVILAALVLVGVGLGYGLNRIAEDRQLNGNYTTDMDDETLSFRDYLIGPHGRIHLKDYSTGVFDNAAVVTHSPVCAKIANDVLKINGTAVDAAIAGLLCESISNPQSMGLGGGFFMIHYDRKSEKMLVIDARETAPAAATEDMYVNRSDDAQLGVMSIAVPGELRGYDTAHKLYGRVEWARLFKPTIELCRTGVLVSKQTMFSLKKREKAILNDPSMSEVFVNPDTKELLKEFDVVKRLKLAETLEEISAKGADALYTGSLAKALIQDIGAAGGILTKEDLEGYAVQEREPVMVPLKGGLELYSVPGPGSGAILGFLVSVLDQVWAEFPANISAADKEVLAQYRFLEACKFAYAKRTEIADGSFSDMTRLETDLADQKLIDAVTQQILEGNVTFDDALHYTRELHQFNHDHGTAHVSVLDAEGNAVSVTSTLNLWFGSAFRSASTGIILNDEMDDFSTPGQVNMYGLAPNQANFIKPGKRPASSMAPAIVVDSLGEVKYIFGGAGGSKIISSIADVYGRHRLLGETVAQAVANPRLHHQLIPNLVEYESDTPKYLLDSLQRVGHKNQREAEIRSSVSVIERGEDGRIHVVADKRRRGGAGGN